MMKFKIIKNLAVLIPMLFANSVFCQTQAVTENGDTIFIYNNGTWSFTEDEEPTSLNELAYLEREIDIETSDQKFTVAKAATKSAKNKFGLFEIKYDTKEWKRIPTGQLGNDEAEMAFMSDNDDVYCLVVSEQIEIGSENILKIAMNMMEERTNGKTNLIKAEKRMVNGTEVVRGLFDVEISGINMRFDSYYFSNSKGTVQFSTWTGVGLWKSKEKEIEKFLNGLIIL